MSRRFEVLKHSPFNALNPIEQEFILAWFMYSMPMEQRYKLMQEHPVIYNKLCGCEIMSCEQKSRNTTDTTAKENIL